MQRRVGKQLILPNSPIPYVLCRPLVQEVSDLLKLAAAGTGIVEKVAEFAGIGLDLDIVRVALLQTRIALEHQNLMLRPASLLDGVHLGMLSPL